MRQQEVFYSDASMEYMIKEAVTGALFIEERIRIMFINWNLGLFNKGKVSILLHQLWELWDVELEKPSATLHQK